MSPIYGFIASRLVDPHGLIASMTCETVMVSIPMVRIERTLLVCLRPHLQRHSATFHVSVKPAIAADRMAMDGSSQL